MASSAADAWADMVASDAKALRQHKENDARSSSVQQQFAQDETLRALMMPDKKKKKNKKKKNKKSTQQTKEQGSDCAEQLAGLSIKGEGSSNASGKGEVPADDYNEREEKDEQVQAPALPTEVLGNSQLVLRVLQRDINLLSDAEAARTRIHAAQRLMGILFPDGEAGKAGLDEDVLGEVFGELQKPLLRRLGDPAEKCRELSAVMLTHFLLKCQDLGPVLPYLYPAVMDRNSDTFVFDLQNNEMVRDLEAHEAKQRGKAIPLPDGGTMLRHKVREPSEEVRLLLCKLMATLVRAFASRGSHAMLGPYFHDTVMFFHACAVDPFPALRIEGLQMLQQLAQEQPFENTMHHYCTALVRSVMPSLRHRRSAVKIAAIRCIGALVACPYRNKCKGGGTDAIVDLVGFREDNVIPICAFYQGETRLNYLGHLVTEENPSVRLELYKMLGGWLTGLLDRWDHAARLLPFLLSALSDSFEPAQKVGLETLDELGRQYEEEHHDDIIEKRQYGVDGAQGRANYEKALPRPWTSRPRLGTRMYVRQHCRRFLHTVLRELQDWKSTTRGHAVGLLRTMLVYMEEHVTMELNNLVDTYFRFAQDAEIQEGIADCAEITGRYVDPAAYLELILPHVEGSEGSRSLVAEARWDAAGRGLVVLDSLLDGSLFTCVVPHFSTIVRALTSPLLVRAASQQPSLCRRLVRATRHPVRLLSTSDGRAAADAHFLATGRLSSLRKETVDLLVSVARLLRIADLDADAFDETNALLDALAPAAASFGTPSQLVADRVAQDDDKASTLDASAWEALCALNRWRRSGDTEARVRALELAHGDALASFS